MALSDLPQTALAAIKLVETPIEAGKGLDLIAMTGDAERAGVAGTNLLLTQSLLHLKTLAGAVTDYHLNVRSERSLFGL